MMVRLVPCMVAAIGESVNGRLESALGKSYVNAAFK